MENNKKNARGNGSLNEEHLISGIKVIRRRLGLGERKIADCRFDVENCMN